MKKNSNLPLGYLLIIGTAFFTVFSYIFGKKVSRFLHPETVAFYWFFGAFVGTIVKRGILSIFDTRYKVLISDLRKYWLVMGITSVATVFGMVFWVMALRVVVPPHNFFFDEVSSCILCGIRIFVFK